MSEKDNYTTATATPVIITAERVQELCRAEKENRLVILPEPRKPLIWGDESHETILCPECETDLMGGFPDESGTEREMFQCPNCGCPVNTKAVCTKEELAAERGSTPIKRRIFVDIDGTMAKWRATASYEELLAPGFYATMEPNWNLVDALRILMSKHGDEIELFSLSAYLSEAFMAIMEKEDWLKRIVPFIPDDHRLFCLCGTDKKAVVPGGIRATDLLLDDYTVNLTDWAERGHGAKVLNGINDTSGSWSGERISIETEPELLAEQIFRLAVT